MADQKHLVSFSLVFLAVAVAVAIFAEQAQGADICAKADYVPLCRSVVKGATDPKVAMKTAIENLIFETKRTRETSVKLGKMEPLAVCKENLGSAVSDLQQSLKYLNTGDKHSLNTFLSGALSFYVTCDDAVAEGGIVQLASKLLTADALLRQMAANCLYLSTLLI